MHKDDSSKISYRAEIDGLRAIAVLSVILYHAQFIIFGRDWFEGGFVGVDIFFVISGYLITRIILREIQIKGSFSFSKFYERRARRILPMLFVVIFVSFPFAWQRLLPPDFMEYAKSILATMFFGSNFFFYSSTTEYGADSSLLKPFLHTWSLGVEEQFYLVFPIILVITFRFFRQHFLTILVGLSLLSLQFSELMEMRDPDLNFYLPFSRFWELLVGCMLAYRELNYKPSSEGVGAKMLPMLGLYLIVYSILFFDSKTPHPSFHTLIPVIGVTLIIGFASKDELIGKILGSKPFVWIGLISYSAYLWHFPVFAFTRVGGKILAPYDKLELLLLTLFLSALSYFIVEKPFRHLVGLKPFLATVFISIFLITVSCVYVVKSDGIAIETRLGLSSSIFKTAKPSYLFGDEGCEDKHAVYFNGSQFCSFGDNAKSKVDFLLLGDSHAFHAQPLLNKISAEFGLRGITGGTSGCPPLLGIYPLRTRPHPGPQSKLCFGFNQNGYEFVKTNGVKIIFLIARWDYYIDGTNKGEQVAISDSDAVMPNLIETRKLYNKAIKRTFEAYKALGVKVVVALQVPHQNVSIARFLEDIMRSGGSIAELKPKFREALTKGVTLEEHLQRQKMASSPWWELAAGNNESELIVIDPTQDFCGAERCPFIEEHNPINFVEDYYALYTDINHASEYGYERLEAKFVKAFGF